jgi:hypothetical protein
MLKRFTGGVLVSLGLVAPAFADLHYTTRTEARKVPVADAATPLASISADMLLRMVLPDGSAEVSTWITPQGTRIEFANTTAAFAAGTVLLRVTGQSPIIMNTRDHTYSRMSLPAAPAMPEITPQIRELMEQLKPETTVTPSGDYATIAGVPAEHVTITTIMKMPSLSGMPALPGIPTSVTTAADVWIAHQYDSYRAGPDPASSLIGGGQAQAQGFAMRSVIRSSALTGVEVETVVTKLVEEPAPAGLFDIPPDYKEVPSPLATVQSQPR